MIDKKMIEYLSNLAKLDLEEGEKEELLKDLNNLEALINQIQKVDTDGVSETFSILDDNESNLRKDEVKKSLDVSETEKLAPDFKNGAFVVPQVIEE